MDEPVADQTPASQDSPWSFNPRTALLIGAAALALIGLLALAAAIDLPSSTESTDDVAGGADGAAGADGGGANGADGFAGRGRIDLGDGTSVQIGPMPGCPGGFQIGENVFVVPDPAACGLQLVPGEGSPDPDGNIYLVPGEGGDIGGFRIGPDGAIELLPPGALGPGDFSIAQLPDGSFGLVRPDGSWVQISPGDDGISMRDSLNGGSQFIPDDPSGQGDDPFDVRPPAGAQPDDDPSDERVDDDDGSGVDWSALKPVLVVLAGLVVVGLLILALRNGRWRSDDEEEEDEPDGDVQDTLADYSAEISALDRMLWEIDQEADPRTAIRRVYGALETGLDNPDMARKHAETPGIYLRRVLGSFRALEAPMQDLTSLFEKARFSEHDITPEMRDRAVHSLVAIRQHYANASAPTSAHELVNR